MIDICSLDNRMVTTDAGKKLLVHGRRYVAENGGIKDWHTHVNPQLVVENPKFENPWQAYVIDHRPEIGGIEHYGIAELENRDIPFGWLTDPNADPRDLWTAMCTVYPQLGANHVVTWMHMALRQLHGIDTVLSADTADEVWDEVNEQLTTMGPLDMIRIYGCTDFATTDPVHSDLRWHKEFDRIVDDIIMRPTYRPDGVMQIWKKDWNDYVSALLTRYYQPPTYDGLLMALRKAHDYFAENGCVSSDHGFGVVDLEPTSKHSATTIFDRALGGETFNETDPDAKKFESAVMYAVGELNQEKGWVTQLHFGVGRDFNGYKEKIFGSDAGGDTNIRYSNFVDGMRPFFNRFADGQNALKNPCVPNYVNYRDVSRPDDLRIVLYNLIPHERESMVNYLRMWAGASLATDWWHADNRFTMARSMEYAARVNTLANYLGTPCDSRSVPTMGVRSDLGMRVAADVLGRMVKENELPMQYAKVLMDQFCGGRRREVFGY